MTGLRRKLHDWATVLGAGSLAAVVAVLFGCGVYYAFIYDAVSDDYRDIILFHLGRMLGFLGFVVGISFAAIRGAAIAYAFIGVMLTLLVLGLLHRDYKDEFPILAVGVCGLILAAAAGLLVRRLADRSVGLR